MKIIRNLVILLVVLIAVAVGVVMVMGNSLIADGIETAVPPITNTDVQVGSVSVGPLTGSASISDVQIGNPAGYNEPYSVKLGKIETSLDVESLFSDKVVIHKIDIVNPEIVFENGKNGNNLQAINDAVQSFIGPETAETEETEPILFVIQDFNLRGAKIKIAGMGMDALNQEITLPDLHLQGIGEKENGVLAADAAKQIFAAVTDRIKKELVKAQAEGLIRGKLNLPGGSVTDNIKSKIKGFFGR